MTTIDFDARNGETIPFALGQDVLSFNTQSNASHLRLQQVGTDTIVTRDGAFVVLAAVAVADLSSQNFTFADGSLVKISKTNNHTLTGSGLGDYIDIRLAGTDTVTAGGGDDTIIVGGALNPTDAINGETGTGDRLIMSGVYAAQTILGTNTVRGVETIELEAGTTLSLKLNNNTVATATGGLTVDASALGSSDALTLDGSSVTNGGPITVIGGVGDDTITGGNQADILTGGDGDDTITGGGGSDVITGGLGRDTLDGGAGNDRFVFALTLPRSDSSPVFGDDQADTINNFAGAGAAGGDIIDLPPYAETRPLAFNPNNTAGYPEYSFDFKDGVVFIPPNWVDDGFADVMWSIDHDGVMQLWVDANDDGLFSEGDLLVYLPGVTSLIESDFFQAFPAWRGDDNANTRTDLLNQDNIYYGQGGDDILNGGGGNDDIRGGADNDTINGDTGEDTLAGNDGDDIINGGDQPDFLYGGSGGDTLRGGSGDDMLWAEYDPRDGGGDALGTLNALFGDGGDDHLEGGAGDDTIHGNDDNDILRGAGGSDQLFGDAGVDALDGGDRDDQLDGGSGLDLLFGGTGVDQLTGGSEADEFAFDVHDTNFAAADVIMDFNAAQGDRISLRQGFNSTLPLVFQGFVNGPFQTGTALPDSKGLGVGFTNVYYLTISPASTALVIDTTNDSELSGDDFVVILNNVSSLASSDFVAGTFSILIGSNAPDNNNTLSGPVTTGDDVIYSVGGVDTIDGLGGDDTINGGAGNDQLSGSGGNDRLNGQGGNDTLNGGDDDDTLYGGSGSDTLNGGEGNDRLESDYDPIGTAIGDAATDTNALNGGAGDDTLFGGAGIDTMHGDNDHDNLRGFDGNDNLFGDNGDDTLEGEQGDDSLDGGSHDDAIDGGTGADQLTGGTGADRFSFEVADTSFAASDRIVDFQSAEGDKLTISHVGLAQPLVLMGQSAGTFALGATLSSTASVGVNAEFARVWWMTRSGGGVALVLDSDGDAKVSDADFVLLLDGITSLQRTDFADTFTVLLGRNGADNNGTLSGPVTNQDDVIYGIGGVDNLNGLEGSDTIHGGIGNDTLTGGFGNDILNGQAGNDILDGGEDNDALYGGSGNDTLNGGAGDDRLEADYDPIGGGGDAPTATNALNGGSGNDFVFGGAGIDTLHGNEDDDTIRGGDSNDQLFGDEGTDFLMGEGDNDVIRGGTGADTIHGGQGVDQLYGDGDGDIFGFDSTHSIMGAADTIKDFDATQGDRLQLDASFAAPRVFQGFASGAFQVGTALPDLAQIGPGFTNAYYMTASATSIALVIDTNNDLVLSVDDFVVILDGVTSLGTTDFVAGTFTVITGTDGDDTNDTLSGPLTDGDDIVFSVGGNDVIDLLDGDDIANGGTGDDQLSGGFGGDTLNGQDGNDVLHGDDGLDTLYGGGGGDTLNGGNDADRLDAEYDPISGGGDAETDINTLNGDSGDDILLGGAGLDTLNGGQDNDTLTGAGNIDVLHGDDGADTLNGGVGDDELHGDAGEDYLSGDTGADVMTGGSESDRFQFNLADATFAAADTVTDFDRASGDTIGLSIVNFTSLPLIWRGMAPASYSATMALPGGDVGPGFMQAWWVALPAGGVSLIVDIDGNNQLGANDFFVEFLGVSDLQESDFVDTFVTRYGTNAADTNATLQTQGPTLEADNIYSVGGNDVIDGLDGDDTIVGGLGNDTLTGGVGSDRLQGQDGNDILHGDENDDFMYGGSGNDELYGGNDDDWLYAEYDPLTGSVDAATATNTLYGEAGDDRLNGGNGKDTLNGGADDDWLDGGANDDILNGNDGIDTLDGGSGNDLLNGGTLADTLTGGNGNDFLTGSEGDDQLHGGDDIDTAVYVGAFALYQISGAAGIYTVTSQAEGTDTLDGIEFLQFANGNYNLATGTFTPMSSGVTVNGTAAADIIDPTKAPAGQPKPGAGNDTIFGNGGNDRLNGGGGDDLLYGGAGNDIYTVADAGDRAIEANQSTGIDDGGTDIVNSSVTFTLESFVENLTLIEAGGAIDGTGNALVNKLIGNSFANTFHGGDGADTLTGNGGNDTLHGEIGADTINAGNDDDIAYGGADHDKLNGEAGNDTLYGEAGNDTITGGTGIDILDGGSENDTLNGGDDADTLLGGDGIDKLDGGAGIDIMYGGSGNDTYTVDDTGDVASEASTGAGIDDGGTDSVTAYATHYLSEFVENLTLHASAGAIDGYGNDGRNKVTGNSSSNELHGGGDVDTISGGGGDDRLYGDDGADTIKGDAGADDIFGGAGADKLTGGADADVFHFGAAASAGKDSIADFTHDLDKLAFVAGEYGLSEGNGLTGGELDGSYLQFGASATGGHGVFLYNAGTRTVSWDSNGAGGAAAIAIATLQSGATLTITDFLII